MPPARPQARQKPRSTPEPPESPEGRNASSAGAARDPHAFTRKVLIIGLWCYLVVVPLRLQFMASTFIGNDSPFHARYASLFFSRIFARTFPTLAYSIWSRQWGDKEFLFHAYLAPFCLSESFLMVGARLGAALLFAGVLVSLALILQRQRVPGALWWAALLPALSLGWDWRMLMVRSHLASVLLILWILFLFEQRRLKPLLILTFLYTWTYTAPYFALLLCAFMALGRWLVARLERAAPGQEPADGAPAGEPASTPSDRTLLLGCAGATLAGLLIHPQTPNQFLTDWLHLSLVATHAWGITPTGAELGSEFQSETLREAFSLHPGILLCLALAWLLAALLPGACGRRARLFLWMTLPAFALYGLSRRFIEYLAPMTVWALALIVADAHASLVRLAETFSRQSRALAALAAVLVVIGLHAYTLWMLDRHVWHPKQPVFTQEQAGRWLAAHAQPGDLVVPLDWTQFPWLYYWAPRLRYVVGLEPTTMEVVYPEKLRYLEEVRLGKRDLDMQEMRQVFPDARYVVVWAASGDAAARLAHKNYVPVFAGPDALVYDVTNYLPGKK